MNTLLYTVLYTSLYFVRFTVLVDILYTNNKVTGRSDLIPKKHFLLPLVPLLMNTQMYTKLLIILFIIELII
jgi:hypothetical protein